jgi:hypothetical protein
MPLMPGGRVDRHQFPACPAWAVFVLIDAILILAALAEQLKQQHEKIDEAPAIALRVSPSCEINASYERSAAVF